MMIDEENNNLGVLGREHDVRISGADISREKRRGVFRKDSKQDMSLTLAEVVAIVRGELRCPHRRPSRVMPDGSIKYGISEEMWSTVFGWFLHMVQKRWPCRRWERYYDEVDDLTMLFFENIPVYIDQDINYYIFLWKQRLAAVRTWLRLKYDGIAMEIPPRRCEIWRKVTRKQENALGIGGILKPYTEHDMHVYMYLQNLKSRFGGIIDEELYVQTYIKENSSSNKKERAYPDFFTGRTALKNFRETVKQYAAAYAKRDELVCKVRDMYMEWKDQLSA